MPLYERKRYECASLPKGWQREEVVRKSGLSAGRIDVFYYSPNGKKFRTKPQLARYLGDTIDLATFDFRTGKINSGLLRKNRKLKGSQYDYARGLRNDNSLLPPIRQTASIFKQPITLNKTQPESKTRHDLKHGTQDKPKQLFWEKRLEGLRATDADDANSYTEEDLTDIVQKMKEPQLPPLFKPVGPHVQADTVLQSLASALHTIGPNVPVVGQTGPKNTLESNPGVFLNPEQPLIQNVTVSDEDIRTQEERVLATRAKLQEILKDLTP